MTNDTYHSGACSAELSKQVAEGLRSLASDVESLPLLSRNDPRLIAMFEAVLHGADAELAAQERGLVERLGAGALLAMG